MKIMSFMKNKLSLQGFFRSHIPNERGVTFIELLVSMAITAVVSVALYGMYNTFYKNVNIQDQVQESLQNARAGLSFMERELLNAGLDTVSAEALMDAQSNTVTFVYRDPEEDSGLSATAGMKIKVKYGLETVSGVQYLYRSFAICADPSCSATLGTNEPIISYVSGLSITYFDNSGTVITPSDAATRLNVRFATIELKTTTKDILPGMEVAKEFTVKTHLRIRNLGIGTTATDNDAPIKPMIVKVRDPGECSSLKVQWSPSTSGDVAGYKVYYGTTSGVYTGVIDVPLSSLSGSTYSCAKVSGNYECTITPDLPALSYSPSDGTADTMYYVVVKSYDNSFNNSVASPSPPASGNPASSISSFAGTDNDTTIN
ncbi:MAG: prepilin-type N-terminal cleavage/methylation domain-containing protein, partial [Proteobacteria bacterium]|nr:prepilin-type N-terminal cleavage/methylation domain-containing protein [Pseudomonadota bacterium]